MTAFGSIGKSLALLGASMGVASIIILALAVIQAWLSGTWTVYLMFNLYGEGAIELIMIPVGAVLALWSLLWIASEPLRKEYEAPNREGL